MSELTRRTVVHPAWNCEVNQCGSKDCPGYPRDNRRSHGNHTEEWWVAIGDSDLAVSIAIYTGRPHASIDVARLETPRLSFMLEPTVTMFGLHVRPGLIPFRSTEYCSALPGGRCAVVETAFGWSAEQWAECEIGRHELPATPDELPDRFWAMMQRVRAELAAGEDLGVGLHLIH